MSAARVELAPELGLSQPPLPVGPRGRLLGASEKCRGRDSNPQPLHSECSASTKVGLPRHERVGSAGRGSRTLILQTLDLAPLPIGLLRLECTPWGSNPAKSVCGTDAVSSWLGVHEKLRSRESNPGTLAYETRWGTRPLPAVNVEMCPWQELNLRPHGSEPCALIR
jgi:hypothetical protein